MPDSMGLLALVVGLSAYLAILRLYAIEQLAKDPPNAPALKAMMFRLVLADAPLVTAGILLAIDLLRETLLTAPDNRSSGGSPSSSSSASRY